jgi:hypothetical protein
MKPFTFKDTEEYKKLLEYKRLKIVLTSKDFINSVIQKNIQNTSTLMVHTDWPGSMN